MAPLVPHPIASLMLEDLRRAAMYCEELGDAADFQHDGYAARADPSIAKEHARRLWAASQVVERIVIAVESLIVQERSRRAYEVGES